MDDGVTKAMREAEQVDPVTSPPIPPVAGVLVVGVDGDFMHKSDHDPYSIFLLDEVSHTVVRCQRTKDTFYG